MTGLLDPRTIRALADEIGLRPTKQRGQNFVHDANTVRRIVAAAGLAPGETVLEVGPGLGSLTLGLLDAGHEVVAVEIDSALAARLPRTVAERLPEAASRLRVIETDALRLGLSSLSKDAKGLAPSVSAGSAKNPTSIPPETPQNPRDQRIPAQVSTPESPEPADSPTALVANLPYNVSVPVILHVLATFPSVRHGLVMVQAEVADRLVAGPGSRTYGTPSAKLAWYASARRVGTVPATVFWPVPNVESGLVSFERRDPPSADVPREAVFRVVDAAFAQRRKMLRTALAGLAGSSAAASAALERAGIDPQARGETLPIDAFARLARELVRPAESADARPDA